MALFVAASLTRLINASPPVTAVPFTVGCWVKLNSLPAAAAFAWGLANTTAPPSVFNIGMTPTQWSFGCSNGGVNANISIGTPTTGAWYFLLSRCITSTNRRADVLNPAGDIVSGVDTTNLTPAVSVENIGDRALHAIEVGFPLDGHIAEWFKMNADIQADGLATQAALVRQIAYSGIFSVPHAIKNLIEYRSLRTIGSDQDNASDVYYTGPIGGSKWTNTNVVKQGIDLPFMTSSYIRPGQRKVLLPT